MRILLLVAFFCAASGAPQAQLRPMPPRAPVLQDLSPLQSSALRAYAYSVGIPVASVLGGYALYSVLPENGPGGSAGRQGEEVAYAIMLLGGLSGSMVGNFTLGARDDLVTSLKIRTVASVGGGGLIFTGGLLCVFSSFGGDCSDGLLAVVYVGAAVLVGGLAGAIGYDLATIPRNAREVQRRQRRPAPSSAAVAPPQLSFGYSLEANAPVLTLRMGL